MANVDILNSNHAGVTVAVDAGEVRITALSERVAGGAGFVNVSGAVTLDLSEGRSFHHTMTANCTGPSFTNVPTTTGYSAAWTWVLRINATGGYTLTSTPTVTFVDGHSFADLDLTANAENIFTFWQVGSITYAALVTNGELALEPYVFNFKATDSLSIPITRTEVIDVANATVLGTGTVVYKRDASVISTETTFTAGTHAEFIVEAEAGQRISVPRHLP